MVYIIIPLFRHDVNIFLEFRVHKKAVLMDGCVLLSSCTVFSVSAALEVAHTLLAGLLKA